LRELIYVGVFWKVQLDASDFCWLKSRNVIDRVECLSCWWWTDIKHIGSPSPLLFAFCFRSRSL